MSKQPDRNTGDMAAQTPGSDPETSGGQPQIPPTSSSVAKTLEKNLFSISGGTPTTILPSAASIQLAQLQAQLTLQRLKFAQSTVNSNTAAASVLSQVLTKVAMSQPLFNSLIGATSAQAGGCMPGPAMPPAGLAYPPQAPALTALVAGGMGQGGSLHTQNSSPLTMNPFVGMTSQSSAHSATPAMNLSKPASSQPSSAFSEYPADFSCQTSAAGNHTYMHDEVLPTQGFHPFGFSGDLPNILPANHGPVKGPQLLSQPHPGFQMDFQNSQASRMQALGYLGEMSAGGFPQVQPSANPHNQGNWSSDQWQNLQPNRPEFAAQPQDMWPSRGQQLHMRNELYNPEEPTSEGKSMVGQPPHLNRPSNCNQNACGPPFNLCDRPPPGPLPERQMQPRELNDFHGLVPSQLPHICSICDKKVFNLKDWEHHVKGKHHIQNCTIFSESSGIGSNNFTRPTNGGVNSCGTRTILTPSDFPLDNSQSHLRTYPPLSHGFSSPPPGSKLFPQRKPGPSRVVHICNLPEGSCTESDVINLGLPFGKVTNYILMRATNQAFLEMAYPEAAQAMVQFYQQKPPAIGEQQLLVRMSKQYKELKLKKPGKNVDSIINDINSQKEREMQKSLDRFPPERPRSRSPFMQSLSPKMESHSPSLTSCCSSQRSSLSPRKGSVSPMLVTKGEWSNGWERRGSRDYHFHKRRNDEKSETTLKNYSGDESDKRGFDRRQYFKSSGRCSPQLLEDSGDDYQGYKDKYAKSGLQNLIPPHSKYKIQHVEDHKKEHKLKSVRHHHSPRTKEKGRDVHQWSGKRTSSSHQDQTEHKDESEGPISPAQTDAILTAQEEKGRSKQDETSDSEVDEENSQCSTKKHSFPRSSRLPEPETERITKEQNTSSESGSETEGEAWYSGSLEEFVTVDEVGGEEEHLMEVQQEAAEIQESDHIQTEQDGKMEASIDDLIAKETVIDYGHPSDNLQTSSPRDPRSMSPTRSLGSDHLNMESENHSELVSNSMNEMQQIVGEELQQPLDYQSCETGKLLTENESIDQLDAENQCRPNESCENDTNQQQEYSSSEVAEPPRTDQALTSISIRSPEAAEIKKQYPEGISGENLSQPMQDSAGRNQQPPHIQQTQLPWKHNNVFSHLSIPLGVEFVEARTGFYCKLCGLFYITEEAAKTSHCRSSVHYKNLQKYLSQLAEKSLQEGERDDNPGMEEEVGIMPQFETKESNPS